MQIPTWSCRPCCLQYGGANPNPVPWFTRTHGSVYTSDDWQSFLAAHGLACSMSRRGNCHDNAPVESFFGLLKRERIRRRIYPTKDAARADAFDYIERFYNPQRRHGSNGNLSPVEFERRYAQRGS